MQAEQEVEEETRPLGERLVEAARLAVDLAQRLIRVGGWSGLGQGWVGVRVGSESGLANQLLHRRPHEQRAAADEVEDGRGGREDEDHRRHLDHVPAVRWEERGN